jgi:hypothetical protein
MIDTEANEVNEAEERTAFLRFLCELLFKIRWLTGTGLAIKRNLSQTQLILCHLDLRHCPGAGPADSVAVCNR